MKKIFLLSLGCPRNLLDSEVLAGLLEKKGFSIVESAEDADVAVVNTCGFIQDAKTESIDALLQLAELKKEGKIQKLVVAGCLAQRYPGQLMSEIPQIDGVFGTADFTAIPGLISAIYAGDKVERVSAKPDFIYNETHARRIMTPEHSVYVKIQEGCSNKCSYCVIPALKGPHRSRTLSSVLREVEGLKKDGTVRELLIIGQDTTSFGLERGSKGELAELLRRVSPLMNDGWVRLLYTHPANFTDELIDVIAGTPNICKYVDLPIQHINDRILRDMDRRTTRAGIVDLIGRIRRKIGDVAIRTSVIVGFPGETDEEFGELLSFLEDIRFERLGAFIFSREEGTKAFDFEKQVPEAVKKTRLDELMRLQQKISAENNLKHLGRVMRVLIEEKHDPRANRKLHTAYCEDEGRGTRDEMFIGRTEMDAPEVDGVIYVSGKGPVAGEFCDVRVTGTMEYDLAGEAA